MKKLITDREYSMQIGKAAYERTKEYYERNKMLENQRKDYIKVLGDKENE